MLPINANIQPIISNITVPNRNISYPVPSTKSPKFAANIKVIPEQNIKLNAFFEESMIPTYFAKADIDSIDKPNTVNVITLE